MPTIAETKTRRASKLASGARFDRRPADDPSPVAVAVTLEYSEPANYLRPAARLADALAVEFDVTTELVPSSGGAFEVTVDGRLVFSKRATCRLPEADEIAYHIRAALEERSRRRPVPVSRPR